jgi:hypothetical protein
MYTSPAALVCFVNEISRNKVVLPEGVAGLTLFTPFLLVEFPFTLNYYYVVRFGMVLFYLLSCFSWFVITDLFTEESFMLLYFCHLIFCAIHYLYRVGLICC